MGGPAAGRGHLAEQGDRGYSGGVTAAPPGCRTLARFGSIMRMVRGRAHLFYCP